MNRSRVASVLRVRTVQERVARAAVVAARRRATDASVRRAAAVRAVEGLATARPSVPSTFAGHRRLVAAGVRDARRATAALERARVGVGASIDDWIDADRRLDGVRRLDDRRAGRAAVDADRRTWVELDELIAARWRADRRGPMPDGRAATRRRPSPPGSERNDR